LTYKIEVWERKVKEFITLLPYAFEDINDAQLWAMKLNAINIDYVHEVIVIPNGLENW
jgi:hypothetical protein